MLTFRQDDGLFWTKVTKTEQYEILVESGSLDDLALRLEHVMEALEARSCVVISDANVARHHIASARRSLDRGGIECRELVIQPGERSKSLTSALRLCRKLRGLGIERRTVLVALGGGVLCDLVGFVASWYMRGLPYVNVPTSLIAQVDGAIGGKVGTDYLEAKNLIGSFYHPAMVLVDPQLLSTLPEREVSSGLAEIIKVAVIASPTLYTLVERHVTNYSQNGHIKGQLERIVRESIAAKLELLSSDPFERSLDRVLNFGHCIGHSLEAATDYRVYRHGEAVAIGMAVAVRVAACRGLCTPETGDRILALIGLCGLQTSLPKEMIAPVWAHLETIKKIRNGSLRFVVPMIIGRCAIVDGPTLNEIGTSSQPSLGRRLEASHLAAI